MSKIAELMGFGSFSGMLMFFGYLLIVFLIGYGIYKAQKK